MKGSARLVWGSLIALALFVSSGCTAPIYSHSVVTRYDAQGKVVGFEEVESISQANPSPTPMKVRITQREKLEE